MNSSAPKTTTEFLEQLALLEQIFSARGPELELTVRDNELEVEGYVVVWNSAIGLRGPLGRCGKGGTRISPTATLEETRMLASRMALKNAAANLPLGGSKSALRANPDAPNFERQYRRFVNLVKPILRTNGGIFGGFGFDLGAKPIHAIWAVEECKTPKCFTGKPVEMGGTDYDREGIAGLGVATAAEAILKANKQLCSGTSFAVQGVGAMGAAVIRYFSEAGGRLVAVSDPRLGGTVVFENPISDSLLEALSFQKLEEANDLIRKGNFAINSDTEKLLSVQCDILFPCARQDVIGAHNMESIRVKYVVEGANNPTSVEAYNYFFAQGIKVVPDFIANPGGVIAAFVEMSSELSPEENVRTRGNVISAKQLTKEKISANVAELSRLEAVFRLAPYKVGRYMALSRMLDTAN